MLFLFQKTNGRLGSRLGKQTVLLLHTSGRNPARAIPLPCPISGIAVPIWWWPPTGHPNWYKNLRQQPRANIQVGTALMAVDARPAEAQEYNRLWELVTRQNDQYLKYQKSTERRIPIVILTPTNTESGPTGVTGDWS